MAKYKGYRNLKREHYKLGVLLTEERKIKILKAHFKRRVGYELDLENPKTFNEKIMWSKLYYQNPLITRCCDKYAVKDYVKEVIGEEYIVPTIARWKRPEDIDFDALPDKFALKVNWSSGYNIIVRDKSKLDREATVEQLKAWMKPDRNSYYQFFNWGFKHMKPVVYAEEYIEQFAGQVYDYKFFVFGGKVKCLFIATDRLSGNLTYDYFDRDFNYMPVSYGGGGNADPLPEKPKHFEKMIELAEKLAAPFPFCRVDFYELGDVIRLGEMTFYSGGGILPFDPPEYDRLLGDWYPLPEKMIRDREPSKARIRFALKWRKCKRKLRKARSKIIRHDKHFGKHYITLFTCIRFPIEQEEMFGRRYYTVTGMQIKHKKIRQPQAPVPLQEFEPFPPKLAYLLEDQITPEIKQRYCEQKGFKQLRYFPNLDDPKSYNEKLLWLALHYKNPHHAVASDKYKAKQWVAERIGEEYVVPLYQAVDNPNQIDWKALPEKFVMKANEGWGADEVLIVEDKSKYTEDQIKALASSWLYPWSPYYYANMCITDEKPEKAMVVFEELLEQEKSKYLNDYKFYCCNGDVKFAMVIQERGSAHQSRTIVDADWNVLPVRRAGKFSTQAPPKPENLDTMFRLARTLCREFPFVRIDFYNLDGRIYVGEMTFTPGLFLRFEPKMWDFRLGEYLDIAPLVEAYKKEQQK